MRKSFHIQQVVLLKISQYESQLRILLYKSTTLYGTGIPHLMMVLSIISSHSPHQILKGMMNTEWPQDAEIVKICRVLEERFKAIEGHDNYRLDAFNLCLVKDMVIPLKFKTPDFEKLVVQRLI